MPELGRAALAATLGLVLYALVAGAIAARTRRRRLADSAQTALLLTFATTLVATLVLLAAFARNDYGFVYVWQLTSDQLPILYTLAALWGGQEGSLLFWLLLLTIYSAAAVLLNRRSSRDLTVWVVPVLATVMLFFSFMLVFVSSPFATQAAPDDGRGLNPSLQNPYMLTHPIFLYLGYVGLTIPFAFAIGSLLARRTDERWIVTTRRATLVAWTALGVGQILGSKWAYEEVGWGGFYAWDPVENAALMPWLAATAFLHSVMVQEKRGMLRLWNMLLVILAFALSIFGTFLTRSGILSSVHSFTESPIGAWFLGFLTFVVVGSLALVLVRLPLLRTRAKLESLVSREASFLYNNLLLVALTLTILWGVLYPIVHEAVVGEARIVGPGYYNFFLKVFGLPLLLLMGIGPLIAWRRASLRGLGAAFAWPAAIALATGAALLSLGAGSSIPGLIAYTFSAFVLASIGLEFARGTRARRALAGGTWPAAFSALVGRNRRRYGGYVVHAAIVLLAIGIAGASAYDTVSEGRLARGETLSVGDYRLTYTDLVERQGANATLVRARLEVARGDDELGVLEAGKNAYTVERQVSNEVGIRTDLLTGTDLFVIAEQINPDGTVFLRVFVKPLVNLLWLAGFVFLFGALITMWPDAREQRRLALRYQGTDVPARP
ncbi:MAG TPA: heme lyase CcmF/NrfE family subunit [Gaiellaceae bacterium]|nr:heme lyase CcmF/NrfE family subunit [Gaiellaceae bacterium]